MELIRLLPDYYEENQTMQELQEYSGTREWVDVCKGWEEEQAKAG